MGPWGYFILTHSMKTATFREVWYTLENTSPGVEAQIVRPEKNCSDSNRTLGKGSVAFLVLFWVVCKSQKGSNACIFYLQKCRGWEGRQERLAKLELSAT